MRLRHGISSAVLVSIILVSPHLEARDKRESFIIQCTNPCDAVIETIQELGGEVTKQYTNLDAVAASLPSGLRPELESMELVEAVDDDFLVPPPRPVEAVSLGDEDGDVSPQAVGGERLAALREAHPTNYVFSNLQTGAASLHDLGHRGDGVIVAVIDTGTANDPVTTPALYDFARGESKVIGGESFIGGASEPAATSPFNHPHGTWVACMIAADAGFIFPNDDPFKPIVAAVSKWAPTSVIPVDSASSMVPMRGSAPNARIYAMKVFRASGSGSPASTIIAAMDRAITLRQNYNDGVPSVPLSGSGTGDDPFVYDSLRIDVVNMSLTGPTLEAGRNMMDQLTLKMLNVGIVPVISAGNSGPAAMTGGSPGTGIGALTVGAAYTAEHERIAAEVGLVFGATPVDGGMYHPSDHIQTAHFSSRGPTADGRNDPEVVAQGVYVFVNAPRRTSASSVLPYPVVTWVSGTSFSSPAVAGAAALLREAAPSASAAQIRNALISSANPAVLGDNSGQIDQGQGFIDIPEALSLLQTTDVNGGIRVRKPPKKLYRRIRRLGHPVLKGGIQTTVNDLMPGQVKHFFVLIGKKTERLHVTVRNIQPALEPADQNPFFGDGLLVTVVDAPTSFAWTRAAVFARSEVTLPIDHPQEGLVRVAITGGWLNAGTISAEIEITRDKTKPPRISAKGKTPRTGVCNLETVDVPPGVTELQSMLTWKYNWGMYPTNDIDLIIVDPNANANSSGATYASPERVTIANPTPGAWSFLVCGYEIHSRKRAKWQLRVSADGNRLRAR
jgi:subtilisin family serine protease